MKTVRRNSSGLFDIPRIYLGENDVNRIKAKELLYAALKILKVEFIRWRCWISWKLWEVTGSDKLPVLVQHGLLCGSRCMMYRVHVVCVDLYVRFMLAWRNEKATTANSLLPDYSAADGIREVRLGAGLDGGMSARTRLGPPTCAHSRPIDATYKSG